MKDEKKTRKVSGANINIVGGLNDDMRKKLVILFLLVLLAFAGLFAKLFYIVNQNGDAYKKKVLSQQGYDSRTIPFRRGEILDAKGNKLATSEKVYNLVIDVKNMRNATRDAKPEDVEKRETATINAIGKYFPNVDVNELRQYVNEHHNSMYKVLDKRLTYNQISGFMQFDEANEDVTGVWFEEEYKRIYPNNTLASDVIGFVGKDNKGTYGLEQYYDEILNGADGREYGYLNEEETLERTTIPATNGYSVVTTIDANIQQIIEKYLYQFNEENKDVAREGNGANNLGCIIMDVNSGEILGMASYPTFDLNMPDDVSRLIGSKKLQYNEDKLKYEFSSTVLSESNIEEELADENTRKENLNNLWKNFCISSTYEPGSTYKPFTVACGLEAGKLTGKEYYTCNGSLQVANHSIKCHNYKKGGCGTLDVKGAIENSCNVSLMLMSRQIGRETFLSFANKFNFGLKTNIDLYGEARTNRLVFTKETMGETELATSSFGQGFNATMIQMITGYCSLINGGYYYEPHVVNKIVAEDGSVVKNISPRVLKQTISAQTSQAIVDYCVGVVEEGTGKSARPAGYMIGGKTGTAETIPRDRINYVLSFMGFAPADNPQIAIYVVVDRPNSWAQDSVSYATKLCRSILTEVLPYMNIYMTEDLTTKEEEELASLNIAIRKEGEAIEPVEDSEEDAPNLNEEGIIDPQGGDITSSTAVTEQEMNSDDVETAPLTGSVLNMETGESLIKEGVEETEYETIYY